MSLLKRLLAWWRGDLDPAARAEAGRAQDARELREGENHAGDINKPGAF